MSIALEDKKPIINEQQPRPWYADEVKRRIEEYKSGNMETYPLDQDFWDRMDKRIDAMIEKI